MEIQGIDAKIAAFLKVTEKDGSGEGDGSGYGSIDGHGYGYGSGYEYSDNIGYNRRLGYVFCDGSGSGSGGGNINGSGSGYWNYLDILEYNHKRLYNIDYILTIINSVHGNYAKGYVLKNDNTIVPCFIARCGNFFAHGETLKRALQDAMEKYNDDKPLNERIAEFNEKYPDDDTPIDGNELFSWHHILTGSCFFGRQQFCKEHHLDVNKKYTVREFISLTKNAYGKKAIQSLIESRNINF